jgi:hydroxyacylglutathione hydrolase
MKRTFFAILLVLAVIVLLVSQRQRALVALLSSDSPPELLAVSEEGDGVRWVDDYFIVQAIDANTFAIGEPRYHQQNFSYLIVGSVSALLFDAGPGVRDIRPIAQALTERPITFVPSHFHFDHVGNDFTFDRVAIVDLPHLRDRAANGKLQLEWYEHLGSAEGFDAPAFEVDQWLVPGETIDLGERVLQVLFTPGHTDDSISLLDHEAGYLFSGDFIYPGPLFAFLPNSRMGDYMQGADTLLDVASPAIRIFGAHRLAPPGAPEQTLADIHDLRQALQSIKAGEVDGEGFYPVTYLVNADMTLLTEPAWLQNWDVRYPALGK